MTGQKSGAVKSDDKSAVSAEALLISVRDAVFGYDGRPIVRVPALDLGRGRCVGIFGPNGSGKTTLVRGLTGLLTPTSGTVTRNVNSIGVGDGSRDAAAGIRCGYLPQYRGVDLLWPMSGFDAAALAASAHGWFGWIGKRARDQILHSMERLEVSPLARRRFSTLSGGQQQRLLLAGALAAEPDVLVLDEPTDGLDIRSRATLLDLLRELTEEGLSTAFISHDVEDLLAICDGVAWLHAGRTVGESSSVEAISTCDLAARILSTRSARAN